MLKTPLHLAQCSMMLPPQILKGKGTKEKHLISSYPDLVNNFTDLRFKAHIQHPVSLVQHQISAPAQICLSSFKEVNKPPWSSNADLNP